MLSENVKRIFQKQFKTKNNHDIKTNYFDNREHVERQRKND